MNLQESKAKGLNMTKFFIIFSIVIIFYMCFFSTSYVTQVSGVEARIDGQYNEYNNEIRYTLNNTNRFKVTIDFFVTYRDNKISKRKTVVLFPFGSEYGSLNLYKDINLENIPIEDLDVSMIVTSNSYSFFGFQNSK